jgi:glycosyltransferase involved in cell wall biosynthesis
VVARVLHVTVDYGSPSETFVTEAMAQTDRLGWEAWLATLRLHASPAIASPPTDRVLVGRRFSLPERIIDRLTLHRTAHARALRLWPGLDAIEPSVVHAHFGWSGPFAQRVARRLDVPLVVTFHGSDARVAWRYGPYERIQARLLGRTHRYEHLFADIDCALAVSEHIAASLHDLGFAGRTEIVPAGVPLDEFAFRGDPPAGALRLLFVGRLVAGKGVDTALRALAAVVRAHPDARLNVVGGGPERAGLQRLASELGLERHVEFLGTLPRPEVALAMRRAHVLLAPSRTLPNGQSEGSPVVTKEAMAIGAAVVATRVGGLPETIPPAHRPELVEQDDPAALAERILAVTRDRDELARRARGARAWVEERFDARVLARRTVAIYEELAATRQGHRS